MKSSRNMKLFKFFIFCRYLHHLTKPGKQKLDDIEEEDEEEETFWQEAGEDNAGARHSEEAERGGCHQYRKSLS